MPTQAEERAVIVVEGLGYRAGGRDILRDVSCSVRPGSFTVVIGENGAGKTTLLKLLMGFVEPTRGWARVFGSEPHRDPHADRAGIAYLSERTSPPVDWSVAEYLEFNRAFWPGYSVETESRLLGEFRLNGAWRIGGLSIGQARRAQIVAALAARPRLLLVDEITAVLDIVGRSRFTAALRAAREEHGTTILMATNILDDVGTYMTDAILLHEGRLRAAFTREELSARSRGRTLTDTLAELIE